MYGNAIASPLRPEKTVAMMMMKTALKKVVTFEYEGACRYTGYLDKSIRLTLECGHEMVRKASAGVPGKARCYFCDRDATSVIDRLVKAGLTPQ
jgi:hypothetical protein